MWQHQLAAALILKLLVISAQTFPVTDSIDAGMDEGLIDTTMVVPKQPLSSAILMSPAMFISRTKEISSYGHYTGYIAKVGDSINITCNISNGIPSSDLTVTRAITSNLTNLVLPEPGRLVRVEDHSMIEVSILDARAEDSGRYNCNNDAKSLTIVEPANPPRITSYQCISYRFQDMACEFQTNSNSLDLVDWSISFATRTPRTCASGRCVNVPCANLYIIKSTNNDQDDTLRCEIRDWVFTNIIYDMTVNGSNPFASSSELFSPRLSTDIAQLAPPAILHQVAGRKNVSVHVQLNELDMHTKVLMVNAPGFLETAIYNEGVRYRVTVYSKTVESTASNKTVPRVYTFVDNSTDTWIQIPDLLPYTTYTLDIISQLNHTINEDVWSDSTQVAITTLERKPEVAPEHSNYGFMIADHSMRCSAGRMVILYWKKVAEVSGKGNGVITSYYIYERESWHKTSQGLSEMTQVNGSNALTETCITNEASELVVVPVNSDGPGKAAANFYVPAASEVIEVRPCDISVVHYGTVDTLVVTWPNLPHRYNITVFWCEVDIEDNCLNKDIQWSEVGNGTELRIEHWYQGVPENVRYKFGLSAHTSNRTSSGIIWAKCTNHIDKDIQPATANVGMQGLEAEIKIVDECRLENRMAERYTIQYCRYSYAQQVCLEETEDDKEFISEVEVDTCSMMAEISLSKHSTDYAFWIISHAGQYSTKSELDFGRTDRKALTWEIAVPLILSLMAVVGITLCVVYFNGQRKKVQKFKHPQLVLPTPSLIEEDDLSDNNEDDVSTTQTAFVQYATPGHSLMPLISQDSENMEVLASRDYENQIRSSPTLHHDTDDSCAKHLPPTLSYQPTITDPSSNIDYKNTNTAESCAELPDDYLQCTTAEPELSLSAQWFLADDSNSAFIDLNKFLVNSGSRPTTKLEVDPEKANIPMTIVEAPLEVEADVEFHTNEQVPDGIYKEKETTSLIENIAEDNTDNNNYCKITECRIQSGLEPIHGETENPLYPTENSSGDSGYVGRNIGIVTCPRSDSISSNES